MATVDTSVNELVINKLTQAQYDALTEKSPTELYFITDVNEEIADSIQVVELPEATVDNLGKIVQYIGETTADYTNGYFYKIVEDYIAPVYKLASINPHEVQIVDSKAFFKFVEDTIHSQGFDGLPLNIGLHINIMFDPMFAEDGKYPVVIVSDDATVEFQAFFDKDYLLHSIGLSNNLEDFSEAVDIMVRVTEPSSTTLMWKYVDVQPTLQVVEIPEASKENIGQIVQYVGKTSTDYNNGYFYKAEQFDPLTAEITNFEQSEFTTVSVEVGDFNLFVEKFGDAYGTYILEADDMFSWYIKKPDGTYNGSAPISYGINITVDGELQTTADAPLGAAAGNLEITIVYAASGGFAWKNIEVQKVDIKKQLPSLSGGAGNFLMTDGVDLYWDSVITPSSYAMKNRAGIIRPSSTYGTTMTSIQYLAAEVKTPAQYEAANNQMFVSKGTLDNVLESYMLAPIPPTDNGTYVLRATVVDGVVTTEWVSEA